MNCLRGVLPARLSAKWTDASKLASFLVLVFQHTQLPTRLPPPQIRLWTLFSPSIEILYSLRLTQSAPACLATLSTLPWQPERRPKAKPIPLSQQHSDFLTLRMAPAAAAESRPMYQKDEKALCFHGELLYEAKVLEVRRQDTKDKNSPYEYRVHYKGWKNTWVPTSLLELSNCWKGHHHSKVEICDFHVGGPFLW